MAFDLKSQHSRIFLLSVILISLSVFFFRESMTLFPSFIHAWTQSDRYALVFGFLNNGFDFFHPQTFNLVTIEGITRVDFPIHEYIVALIMKFTGIHEAVVFRMYTLTYALIGLVFLFRLSRLFNISFLKNLLVVLFLFFCPVLIYYANGFLPSIPSLANLFIGYFFYFRYKKEKSTSDFRLAIFFLTLAALARLPFFIFLFAVFCQQCLGYFLNKRVVRKELIAFGISFAAFGIYQLYNSWLAKKYGSQFLVSFLPPSDLHQLKEWLGETWSNWRFEYFTGAHYLIIGVLLVVAIIQLFMKGGSTNRFKDVFAQIGIAGAGSFLFFFLMLKQFPHHDYYFIDSFYPVVGLLMVYLMSYSIRNKILNYGLGIILTALMIQSFINGNEIFKKRFNTGYWDRVELSRNNFWGSAEFLDSIGIAKDAKVLVLDGYTTNVPLLLMNRKGWTVNWTTRENIEAGMLNPFDFVAIQNTFVASDVVRNAPAITTQLEKFADNGLISFYRKKENQGQTFDRFFGIDSANTLFTIIKNDSALVDDRTEFIELFSDSSSRFPADMHTKILVTGKILRNDVAPQLIASVSSVGNSPDYFSFDLNEYTAGSGGWQNMLFQFVIPARTNQTGMVKIYFWNYQKGTFHLDDLKLVGYR